MFASDFNFVLNSVFLYSLDTVPVYYRISSVRERFTRILRFADFRVPVSKNGQIVTAVVPRSPFHDVDDLSLKGILHNAVATNIGTCTRVMLREVSSVRAFENLHLYTISLNTPYRGGCGRGDSKVLCCVYGLTCAVVPIGIVYQSPRHVVCVSKASVRALNALVRNGVYRRLRVWFARTPLTLCRVTRAH